MRTLVIFGSVVALFALVWSLASYALHIPPYLLPGPGEVARRGFEERQLLATAMVSTSAIAIGGIAAAVVISFILGPLSFVASKDEGSFIGVLILLQSIPVVVLAPILNIWLGNAAAARVIVSALFALFPLSISLVRSLQEVPSDLILFGRAAGCGKLQLLRHILIPWALGGFFTGLRVAAPLALVGAIVGELSGSDTGIGYQMQVAQRMLDMELLFAGVICSSAGGLLIYLLTIAGERLVLPWRGNAVKT